jgi:hypothetical protein
VEAALGRCEGWMSWGPGDAERDPAAAAVALEKELGRRGAAAGVEAAAVGDGDRAASGAWGRAAGRPVGRC